jgi:TolB-like protein
VDRDESAPVKTSPAVEPAALPTPAEGGKAIVAVLPLAYRVGDEAMESLAEDLTEEITRELAQGPFFKVIAAGTMAPWRGKAVDYQALGRQLGADYLIEAKLQRTVETIRLTAQLIEAATDSMLQSARLSRKLSDIEASPEEFPGTVASQLGQLIMQVEMNRAMTRTGSLSGWDHLLRARACTRSPGSETSRSFSEEARQAVAALPNVSLAHAMLAAGLATRVIGGYQELDAALSSEIQNEIKSALRLGAHDPVTLGYLHLAYRGLGDGEACLRLARRAVELGPNTPRSKVLLAMAFNMLGRGADAAEALKEFDRLSPADQAVAGSYLQLGLAYLLEGAWAEAEAAYEQALTAEPDVSAALQGKAVAAALQGNEQLALATIRRLRVAEPTVTIDQHERAMLRYKQAADRLAAPVAAFRRLWAAVEAEV